MLTDEKLRLTFKLVDLLEEGVYTDFGLAKRLKVNLSAIRRYKPYALAIIQRAKLDRNVIRSREIAKTYRIIEQLTEDLQSAKTAKDKALYYAQIAKFSNHLALIAGLAYDSAPVQPDASKLVIVRP